ncbi:MAG: hypothetical protein ASARMPREDX12_004531 [Alectoria sarmentosa]|nr:MAG: hypothetical protein ASARMPREDX12_004531 [Alectoria sarmentosa]
MTSPPLTIAFIYDEESPWQLLGLLPNQTDHSFKGIAAVLEALGHQVIHIDGIRDLVSHLAKRNHTRWDLAFNIAEGMYGLAREAQVPCLLEAYGIRFTFSDAATTSLCLDKGRTKMVLQHLGIHTAPFAIIPTGPTNDVTFPNRDLMIERAIENSRHVEGLQQYPLFAKPIGEGTSKGILPCSKITKPEDLALTVEKLSALYGNQDILLEPFLSGREITVGILGAGEDARVIGANEYVYKSPPQPFQGDGEDDTLLNFASDHVKNAPMDTNPHMTVRSANLADPQVHNACQLALTAWKALGCRDAGRIDTRFDRMGEAGLPCVLEVNPIPGIIPDWSDLAIIATSNGFSYEGFLNEIVNSALKRGASRRPGHDINQYGSNGDGEDAVSESVVTRRDRWEKYNLRT